MTVQAQQILENKIRELRATVTFEQWNDADYLLTRVEELKKTDLALAFRVIQRVRNLAPTEANNKLLKKLTAQALAKYPELATSVSKISSAQYPMIIRIKRFVKMTLGLSGQSKLKKFRHPFVYFVVLPFLLVAFYQILLASPRYESQAQLIVKEPNGIATLDPAMAVMSGFGISNGNSDTELVKSYIHSNDMLTYLESELNIEQHFSNKRYDFISRLSANASREDQLAFFLDKVAIQIDDKSQIITIKAQAFESKVAELLNQAIFDRAEWYINEVGRNLAKEQLYFVQQEHALVQEKLRAAKSVLLDFQSRYNLLDPEAEGMALQQISYEIEGLIAAKKTELRALKTSMSDTAPLVMQARTQLDSLTQQLYKERNRLTDQSGMEGVASSQENELGVGQILAKYSDYKIDLELALQSYTSSLISLEKSRIEAYRQLKYLVVVETPTVPEDATYPNITYNLTLMLVLQLMLFGVGKIILATVKEMR
jgi:capsular polysaccharide transport system permease protein